MKRMIEWIACVAIAASLSACGGGEAEKPEEAFRMAKDALAKKDYEATINLLSKDTHEKLKKERLALIERIKGGVRKDKEGTVAMLEKAYGVSSFAELEKLTAREFVIRRAKHADETGKGTGLFAKIVAKIGEWEFVETEMEKGDKTAILVIKKEGKEDRLHAVLEDDGWKLDFSK